MEIATVTPMGEEITNREEATLELGLPVVKNTLTSMSLVSVTIGDFLAIMRSDFDLAISGEPYTGLVMLLNLTTGKYLSRIWNQTVATGIIVKVDHLMEACENIFGQGRPCLGFPEVGKHERVKQDCLISQTPIPRRISTTCLKVLGKDTPASVSSCSECMKLSRPGLSSVNNFDKYVKPTHSLSEMRKENEDSEALDNFKTEFSDEYVDEDWNACDTKHQILSAEAFQVADSVDCRLAKRRPVVHENKEQRDQMKDEIRNHVCEECGYATAHKPDLRKHIEGVHEKIKNHVCGECGFAASQKSNLKSHI